METKNLEKLEENIGYKFTNKKLLQNALTHTSYAYEHGVQSNEKLEFLGDSILEFVSSEYMYNKYLNLKEGQLTKVRATVVCEKSLYKVATAHNFGEFLYLGKSEIKSGGSKRPAILADSVEAVIAAIFIDGGLEPAKKFIINNLKQEIEIATKHVGEKDPILETDDYILIREPGEEIGNYKLTAQSKSKNYIYEIVANDTFTILDSKQQSIRPEEKEDSLLSVNASNKDKNKYASATDMESNKDIETKVDKESAKTETKVVTGVSNLTSMYLFLMISSLTGILYIVKKVLFN